MFRGIALKIWLPFISITLFVGIALLVYIPSKQRQIILEQKENELSEVAKNLALSVEFSIKDEDFSSLKKSMDYVKNASDISYIAVYSVDQGKDTSLFEIFPSDAKSKAQIKNKKDIYITSNSPFKTEVLSGFVEVAQKKEVVENTVSQVVKPIYLIILSAFIFTILISLYVAKLISNPLVKLASITKDIEQGIIDKEIPQSKQKDEVGYLFSGMESLRTSLVETRNRNIELTNGLEREVKAKTKELSLLLIQLKEAQKVAKLGNFLYDISSDTWTSSEEFDLICNVRNGNNRNLESFIKLVKDSYKNNLSLAFSRAIEEGEIFDLEVESDSPRNDKTIYLSFFARVELDKNHKPKNIFGVVQDVTERRKTEEEIRKLSMVARNTSNGVVITNTNYEITWVNDSFTKITGYTLEEIRGKKPSVFQFEQTNLETKEKIRNALKERRSVQAEILNKGKTGNIYWLDIYIEPLYDDNKVLNGFIAIEIDITERKHNLELQQQYIRKIEESEKQIRAINESLEKQVEEKTKSIVNLASFPEENPDPIFEFSKSENGIIYLNPAGKKLIHSLGISESEIWSQLNLGHVLANREKELILASKTYEINFFQSATGDSIRFYLYDITDRKQSEEQLIEYVSRLKKTEESLREKTIDLEGAIEHLKFSQAELVNKEKLASLGILVAGIAHEVNTPLGAIQASSGNLIKLFNEELMRIISKVSHHDFMEAVRIFQLVDTKFELNFSEERQRAKNVSAWLSQFELKVSNPHLLSRSLVALNLDQKPEELNKILRSENYEDQINLALVFLRTFRSIKIIEDASVKGSLLIKALNSYSHGSGGETREEVKIRENIDNCILILWNKIKKGAKVNNHIPAELVYIASGGELSQVWTNILNNALQASDNSCVIDINYLSLENFHRIAFSNNGPEIPQEHLSRIFEPFFTTKLRGEGTGLGLSIIKNILEKKGGRISCESSRERTVFYIDLPK